MQTIKNILKKTFSNFYYFFRFLRYRIFLLLFLSIIVALLDGFGIAMFLPLLQMIAEPGKNSAYHMGRLSFLIKDLGSIGLELNLVVVLIVMLAFFCLKGGFKFLESYFTAVYQQFFIRNIRESNIKALSVFNYNKFALTDAGRIQNTMTGEVQRVSLAYRSYMFVIQFAVMILVYGAMAFFVNPKFAILVLIGGGATNLIFNKLYAKTKELSRQFTHSSNEFQGFLIQQVAFFKYLKATGLIKKYSERLVKKVYDIEDSQKKIGILNGIMTGLREPLLIAIVVVVIFVEVKILSDSLGTIILSLLFFYRALNFVTQLQMQWGRFLSFAGSLENLDRFIAELKAGKDKKGKVSIDKFNKKIILENVSFTYTNYPILHNVNLTVNRNETIAVVGESGSGKTTLVNLISGLLVPGSGSIRIDEIDLSEINKQSYHNRIGYITQEPVVFDDSIFNNVTFWDEKTPENLERFNEALRKGSIYDFVAQLEEKEDSRLGINGINLSGGQRQRISIARELYKDIDILIMDEATSSLDSEIEKSIQYNIDQLKGKYTIIIVAHRLATIKNVDRIVVMKNGNVSQCGSYEQLIRLGTDFKRMVELQEL